MVRQAVIQYNVSFPNEPRKVAEITRLLAKEKIGIKSIATARIGNKAAIQFLARRDVGLRQKLEKHGTSVQESEVVAFDIPNHPWELHKLALALEKGAINIISLTGIAKGDHLKMMLAVDQPTNAVDLLSKSGFLPDYLFA